MIYVKFKYIYKYVLYIGLPEEFKGKRKNRKDGLPYEEKEKLVLDGM